MATHYETLGVTPGASPEEIRAAYRRLAKELHPDVNKSADATARMAEVNVAFSVLSDPDQRRDYDREIQAPAAKADPGGREARRQAATEEPEWMSSYARVRTETPGHHKKNEYFAANPGMLHDGDLWWSLWRQHVENQKRACMWFDERLAYESTVARYAAIVATENADDSSHWVDKHGRRVPVAGMPKKTIEMELERLYRLRTELRGRGARITVQRDLALTERNIAALEAARLAAC